MGVHVPVQAHAHSRISTSYMSHDPRDPYGPGAQHDQRHVIMSLNPPASPEPEMAISMPLNLMTPLLWPHCASASGCDSNPHTFLEFVPKCNKPLSTVSFWLYLAATIPTTWRFNH